MRFFDLTYGLPFGGFLYDWEVNMDASDGPLRDKLLAWRVEDKYSNCHSHFPTLAMANWFGSTHFKDWSVTPEAVTHDFIRELYFGPMLFCGVPGGLVKEKFKLLPNPRAKK